MKILLFFGQFYLKKQLIAPILQQIFEFLAQHFLNKLGIIYGLFIHLGPIKKDSDDE